MVAATRGRRSASRIVLVGLIVALALTLLPLGGIPGTRAQFFSDIGYIGPSHGGLSSPTGEKPESKLWYTAGYWWADMYSPMARRHHIFRFHEDTYEWVDTGTTLDHRASSRSDILWDDEAERLYVVSHVFSTSAESTSAQSNWGLLYRYHYDASILRFLPDEQFPVAVTRGKSEALTLAKDSTGRLWVAYVENRQVMFNHSEGDDSQWGIPQALPAPGAGILSSDDIAAVISFGGDRIGIAWSNQRESTMYFAVHHDSAPLDDWTEETIIRSPQIADDHINLKADQEGRVYLASKTSDTHASPLTVLYVRSPQGAWAMHPFGSGFDGHTRPIVLIDEVQRQIHMFATAPESGGLVYYKQTSLDAIEFAPGVGEVVIHNAVDGRLNNVTSTKQPVNETGGVMVMASGSTNRYFFNYLPVTASSLPPAAAPDLPPTAAPSPSPDASAISAPIRSQPAGDAPGLAPALP